MLCLEMNFWVPAVHWSLTSSTASCATGEGEQSTSLQPHTGTHSLPADLGKSSYQIPDSTQLAMSPEALLVCDAHGVHQGALKCKREVLSLV